MNDSPLATASKKPELQSDLIDQVCDRFEAAVRAGQRPRIEDYLNQYPQLDRRVLLQELVALEVELLGTKDESVTLETRHAQYSFEAYYQRFPDASPVLDELQKELGERVGAGSHLELVSIGNAAEGDTVEISPPVVKRRIKQFELQTVIGQGGFGIVWHARDRRLLRDVAIKVPRPDRLSPADKTMFLREARAAAKLHHPHIIAIHEVGEFETEIYIVSELVQGVSLKTWLENQLMSPSDAASLIAKMAAAVQHAHDQGIVHRDLKPANVLIDKKGEPHVADFGLAKRDSGEESLSVKGQLMGTPAYMAPEQARGDHAAIDARTDIYALGAIFYELLTGVRPFRAEMSMLLDMIQHTPPQAPRLIKPEVPRELEAICLKCLAKEPAKRYASAQALADDLYLFLAGETLRGIPAAVPHRVGKWLRRHRTSVFAVGVAFCLSLAIAGSVAWHYRGTKPVPIDMRRATFNTKPQGAEITLVTLDPKTGDPDPTRIQPLKGRTPLTVDLVPNDYLVVAVLDEHRFQEVYRHIPSPEETIPTRGTHRHWLRGDAGSAIVPMIDIPGPDVTAGMAYVEQSGPVVAPPPVIPEPLAKTPSGAAASNVWRIPPFYVDRHEMSAVDVNRVMTQRHGLERWTQWKEHGLKSGLNPGPHSQVNYSDAAFYLEIQGKRLPTAAELYYLSKIYCPSASRGEPDANQADACLLRDNTRIYGLHSGIWEWTTTRPDGLFTGVRAINKSAPLFSDTLLKMAGGFEAANVNVNVNELNPRFRPVGKAGFRVVSEVEPVKIGARGYRSIRPRLKPEDFMTPVSNVSIH